jgi:hypothetical protein
MASVGTTKRISRIMRRAAPEVREAFESGQITARCADTLLYLEPEAQRRQLARLLAAQEDAARRSRIAAQVVRKHLLAGRRDLVSLRQDLRRELNTQNT